MLRLLHTADVHLGARHADLGEAAAAQRERQFAAFRAAVDLAIAEKVDLFLVAGDLFDSNVQPKRSVERVAAELARLAQARIRSVLVPGHPRRLRPLVGVSRLRPGGARRHPAGRGDGHRPHAGPPVDPPRRGGRDRPRPVLPDQACAATARCRTSRPSRPAEATWHIGLLHASVAIPGRTDNDEVVVTVEEIAASGLDYLALGHWHSAQVAKTKGVTYAYAGAPEPVAVDQDKAGKVLLVTLDVDAGGQHVGQRRPARRRQDLASSGARSTPRRSSRSRRSIAQLTQGGDPDLVLDVRLIGVRPDGLDLEPAEVEQALRAPSCGCGFAT